MSWSFFYLKKLLLSLYLFLQKRPPSKKQKNTVQKCSAAKGRSENNEPQWQLSADKLIKIREFKGKLYIDIRQYYNGPNGDLLPTKKGVSLTPEIYQKFKNLIGEIDEELSKF